MARRRRAARPQRLRRAGRCSAAAPRPRRPALLLALLGASAEQAGGDAAAHSARSGKHGARYASSTELALPTGLAWPSVDASAAEGPPIVSNSSGQDSNQACVDYVPPGQLRWFDPYGYGCAIYEGDLCSESPTANFGHSANEACCACGGGVRQHEIIAVNFHRRRSPGQGHLDGSHHSRRRFQACSSECQVYTGPPEVFVQTPLSFQGLRSFSISHSESMVCATAFSDFEWDFDVPLSCGKRCLPDDRNRRRSGRHCNDFLAEHCRYALSSRRRELAAEANATCQATCHTSIGCYLAPPREALSSYVALENALVCETGTEVDETDCSAAAQSLGFGSEVVFTQSATQPHGCCFDLHLMCVYYNALRGRAQNNSRFISICRSQAWTFCPEDDHEASVLCRVLVSLGSAVVHARCSHAGVDCSPDGHVHRITWTGREGGGSRALSGDVAKLVHLTSLSLSDPMLTVDASSLEVLKNLEFLALGGVTLAGSVASLNLVNLKVLKLYGLQAEGRLDLLLNTTDLVHLTLKGNERLRCSLSDVAGKRRLQKLIISSTKVEGSTAHLRDLTELEVLKLQNVAITGDLEHIRGLTSVTVLSLSNTSIQGQMRSLTGLTKLNKLVITSMPFVFGDLADLSFGRTMSELKLENVNLTGDTASLAAMTGCSVLALSNTSVTGSLKVFEKMRQLTHLYLRHTKVFGDIGHLFLNYALRELDLGFSRVSGSIDDTFAYSFPSMTVLRLESTDVNLTVAPIPFSREICPFGDLERLSLDGCSLNISVWDLFSIFSLSKRLANVAAANAGIHGHMTDLRRMLVMTQNGGLVGTPPLSENLISLDLRRNLIAHAAVPARSLRMLDLSDNPQLTSADDEVFTNPHLRVDIRRTALQREDLFQSGFFSRPDEEMMASSAAQRGAMVCSGIPGRVEVQVTPDVFAPISLCSCCIGYERVLSGAPPNVRFTCEPCQPGKFSSSLVMQCTECPRGREARQNMSSECRDCAAGRYASRPGQPACEECPDGTFSDTGGHAECHRCAWFTPDSNQEKTDCTVHWLSSLSVVNLSLLICIVQLFLPRYRKCIEDLSEENGKWVVMTAGRHWLRTFSRGQAIRLRFEQTGHPALEAGSGSRGYHTARILSSRSLELVGPVHGVSLDTSSGMIRLGLIQTLLFCGVRCLNLGLVILIGFAHFILVHSTGDLWHTWKLILVSSFVAGTTLMLVARPWLRGAGSIRDRVERYREELLRSNPSPTPCPPGPGRAVKVAKIVDLYTGFQGYIRERNMYYVNANILTPVTRPLRLSFAELAGPSPVKWFVSHYWGHSLRHFVDSIRSHAEGAAAAEGSACWQDEAYWICSLSNNQHKLEEELGMRSQATPGETWKHSSFYLALQSKSCHGTAMVLDEHVQPLTRSWCLFEVLQTFKRTQEREEDTLWEGLHFCTSAGVLNDGGGSVDLAIAIAKKLACLQLEEASASEVADKEMIDDLIVLEGGFEKMNKFMRENFCDVIREVEQCLHRDFDQLKTALEGRRKRKTKPEVGRKTDPTFGSEEFALRWKLADLRERLVAQEVCIAHQQRELSQGEQREVSLIGELERRDQELGSLRQRGSLRPSARRLRAFSQPVSGDVELAEARRPRTALTPPAERGARGAW